MEAVQVGCGDATHLGRVVCLQWRQQRLADVEVSVLQLALQQMVSKKYHSSNCHLIVNPPPAGYLEHEPELVLLLGGAAVDAGGVQVARHLVHLVPGAWGGKNCLFSGPLFVFTFINVDELFNKF